MKIEEATVGMRVGLCRSALKKEYFSKGSIEHWDRTYFPGFIVAVHPSYNSIRVSHLQTNREETFPSEWLAPF